jgi:dipeptidase E
MTRHLLLASNSTPHGAPVLSHLTDAMAAHFARARRIGFIGFAKKDLAAYTARVRPAFERIGTELVQLEDDDTLAGLDGVYVGGGNTWLLVKRLHESGWMHRLDAAASHGFPYMGASAGTNIAAPTLCTTNDMPIVQPPAFTTLNLVPFQINPHYLDPDPNSTHKGETREERILEYLEHNDTPVLGLREGSWLTLYKGVLTLKGSRPARLFRTSGISSFTAGADLSSLL